MHLLNLSKELASSNMTLGSRARFIAKDAKDQSVELVKCSAYLVPILSPHAV